MPVSNLVEAAGTLAERSALAFASLELNVHLLEPNKQMNLTHGELQKGTVMRSIIVLGITAGAVFTFSQSASAERVCNSVCDGPSCVQRCVDRDHDRGAVVIGPEHRRPGVDIQVPGVGVQIGR